ncbi:unnamed protein product [Spirodela intermedia]|uniref:Uncharacterized protein n=1 Tax=Spirodela intermedia TaxID=51605 RepID=A0A7I8JI94_SPIIN|nr:unnamed protein product [Spirodela intermedia]CAA6669866.1 unnamed protein product [Spirodela intermedia]
MASQRGLPAAAFLFLLLAAVAAPVTCRFVVEKGSVSVLSPENLRGSHNGAIANFGVPNYAATLVGSIVYPDKGTDGCDSFNDRFKSPSSRPVILLLDRGVLLRQEGLAGQEAGAAAVLIVDNQDEPLITMDTPKPPGTQRTLLREALKKAVAEEKSGGGEVVVKLDWTESMPHPDDRVEYELWTNSNDECGLRCDEQINFVKNFKGHAQLLERGGYTLFTPHYITWYCPSAYLLSRQCKSQCINNGRYCAPDPEKDFGSGYEGKDVVIENLRQLCVHRVANETRRPWVWWDFVTDFHLRCSMKQGKYSLNCAEEVVRSLGLPGDKIKECMGDPTRDAENPVLKNEQDRQVGNGSRGDVTILPTLLINDVQYRGQLDRTAVLQAVCAGFKETTEPHVCLNSDLETNECLENHGGCWHDSNLNISACKDTFRGRVCQCPTVNDVHYSGDGYTSCRAVGPGRCALNNGGCWSETRDGKTFSACSENELKGCRCPSGFSGDGKQCTDIDECKDGIACQCDRCSCKNNWGGFDCTGTTSKFPLYLMVLFVFCVGGTGVAGYIFYKYRLRSYMDSEIMAIMSQYMPIDNQSNEVHPLMRESTV